jgi:hypothetical protein
MRTVYKTFHELILFRVTFPASEDQYACDQSIQITVTSFIGESCVTSSPILSRYLSGWLEIVRIPIVSGEVGSG